MDTTENLHEQLAKATGWSRDDSRLDQFLNLFREWQISNPTVAEARTQLEQNATLVPMSSLITFEGATVVGGVTIGDVAGGNLAKLNFVQTNGGDFAAGNIDKRQGIFITIERPDIGIPFQVPPLPAYFVARPDITTPLKAQLLNQSTTSTFSVLSILAIHGMGGTGKSTLASALARDPEVLAHFPDGVLWATLGQQPNLLSLLSSWVQELGDYQLHLTAPDIATNRLRSLLQSKAMLLVIDDAWDTAYVRPFLVGGPRCRVIITTRDALIAKDAGAIGKALHNVNVMTSEQALALMAKRLERPLEGPELAQARQLATATGYLPLALELAVTQVADGVSWSELLMDLQAEIARLETLEPPGAEELTDEVSLKKLSLRGSINLSLHRLSVDKQRNFAWLGVLPEDVTLTPAMAATLWETERKIARDTLRYFRDKALLLPGVSLPDGSPTYRLHDVLHDLARKLLTAPLVSTRDNELPGLGLTLVTAHVALLERYQVQTKGGLWHTLSDDGYIHARLAWHLEQAGWHNELHKLLREETTEGHNGWFQARERLGQVAGYLSDVSLARHLTEMTATSEIELGKLVPNLGRQTFYALVLTSVNSLAASFPLKLLVALVKKGEWTWEHGLTYARQLSDPRQRAVALRNLAPFVPETLRIDIFIEASASGDVDGRELEEFVQTLPKPMQIKALDILKQYSISSEVLVDIATRLADSLKREILDEALLDKLLNEARTIEYDSQRAERLTKLIPHLREPQRGEALREALAAARASEGEDHRAEALIELAPFLAEPLKQEVLGEALVAVLRSIEPSAIKTEAFIKLIPYLPKPLLRKVLTETDRLKIAVKDALILFLQIPNLTKSEQEQTLPKLLVAVQTEEDEVWKQVVLARLLPLLAKRGEQNQALSLAKTTPWSYLRGLLLADLVPYLAEPALREALTEAQTIKWNYAGARALVEIARRLAELGFPDEALDIVLTPSMELFRTRALARLAPYLSESLLQESLRAVQMLTEYEGYTEAMIGLASRLAELGQVKEALTLTNTAKSDYVHAQLLVALLPYLLGRERESALRTALTKAKTLASKVKADVIAACIPYLSEIERKVLLQKALAEMLNLKNVQMQSKALVVLAPYMSQTQLEKIIVASRAMKGERWRAETLIGLAPYLLNKDKSKVLREALAAVWARARSNISPNEWPIEALLHLIPLLTKPIRGEVQKEALLLALEASSGNRALRALTKLVPQLPEPLLGDLLFAIRANRYSLEKAEMLATILPRLSEPTKSEVQRAALTAAWQAMQIDGVNTLDIVEVIEEGSSWPGLPDITSLAFTLPEPLLREALVEAETIQREYARSQALAALVPRLAELGHLDEALEVALTIGYEKWRAHLLDQLAPYLSQEQLREAIAHVLTWKYKHWRAQTLAALAPYLPSSLLQKVFAVVRMIGPEHWRPELLAELALHLPRQEQAEVLQEALKAARALPENSIPRAKALCRLAIRLPATERPTVVAEALSTAQAVKDSYFRDKTLAEFSSDLVALGYPEEALLAARSASVFGVMDYKALLLARLVPHLQEPLRSEVHKEALAAEAFFPGFDFAIVQVMLELLSPHLSKQLLRETLAVAQSIEQEYYRAEALVKLAPYLPESLMQEALVIAQAIGEDLWRVNALAELNYRLYGLASSVHPPHTPTISQDERQAHQAAAVEFSRYLPESQLRGALIVARKVENERLLADTLAELAFHLPEPLLREALMVAETIKDEADRGRALAGMAPYLSEMLLREALAIAWAIRDDLWQSNALVGLVPRLAELGHLEEAVNTARKIDWDKDRANVLMKLVHHLADPLRSEVIVEILATVRKRADQIDWGEESVRLISQLAELGYNAEQLFAAARLIEFDEWRAKALVKLVPNLLQLPLTSLYLLWQETLHLSARRTRQNLLADISALTPIISKLGGQKAISETLNAIRDVVRWWP